MAQCKECLHYEICEIMAEQYGVGRIAACQCGFYTNAAVTVRRGEWLATDSETQPLYTCSVCGKLKGCASAYCSSCGAKMEGGEQ